MGAVGQTWEEIGKVGEDYPSKITTGKLGKLWLLNVRSLGRLPLPQVRRSRRRAGAR